MKNKQTHTPFEASEVMVHLGAIHDDCEEGYAYCKCEKAKALRYARKAVNSHEELLSLLREFVYGPATAEKRAKGMQVLARAEGK
jgi:hypothetical protein